MTSPWRCEAGKEVVVRHPPCIEQWWTHVRKLTHGGKRGWWKLSDRWTSWWQKSRRQKTIWHGAPGRSAALLHLFPIFSSFLPNLSSCRGFWLCRACRRSVCPHHWHKDRGEGIQSVDFLQLNCLDVRLQVLLGEAKDAFLRGANVDELLPEFSALPNRDESHWISHHRHQRLRSCDRCVQQLGRR